MGCGASNEEKPKKQEEKYEDAESANSEELREMRKLESFRSEGFVTEEASPLKMKARYKFHALRGYLLNDVNADADQTKEEVDAENQREIEDTDASNLQRIATWVDQSIVESIMDLAIANEGAVVELLTPTNGDVAPLPILGGGLGASRSFSDRSLSEGSRADSCGGFNRSRTDGDGMNRSRTDGDGMNRSRTDVDPAPAPAPGLTLTIDIPTSAGVSQPATPAGSTPRKRFLVDKNPLTSTFLSSLRASRKESDGETESQRRRSDVIIYDLTPEPLRPSRLDPLTAENGQEAEGHGEDVIQPFSQQATECSDAMSVGSMMTSSQFSTASSRSRARKQEPSLNHFHITVYRPCPDPPNMVPTPPLSMGALKAWQGVVKKAIPTHLKRIDAPPGDAFVHEYSPELLMVVADCIQKGKDELPPAPKLRRFYQTLLVRFLEVLGAVSSIELHAIVVDVERQFDMSSSFPAGIASPSPGASLPSTPGEGPL